MSVLLDIEWTEQNEAPFCQLTQVSALRVDNAWREQGRYGRLVCPKNQGKCNWDDAAYNGHAAEEFLAGISEGECIKELFAWVEKGETIFCWQSETRKVLLKVYRRYFQDGDSLFNGSRFVCINERLKNASKISADELYEAAQSCGVEAAARHCSDINVDLMQQLLCSANITANQLLKVPDKKFDAAQRRAKNQKSISKMSCSFVYAPRSTVFHRCGCKLVLCANTVIGCAYYSTAAKGRRPCKVCKPVMTAVDINREKNNKAATEIFDMNEVVKVRLIDGSVVSLKRKNIVGSCHSKIHPGRLNEKLMEEHDCQGKQCHYFEPYENASYWVAKRTRQMEKQYIRQQRHRQQEKKAAAAKSLDELRRKFQEYMDAEGYPVYIVRLEPVKGKVYKVFYVSDYQFADGQLYSDFYAAVSKNHPGYWLLLRHIKDENGRFVTREEYIRRVGRI